MDIHEYRAKELLAGFGVPVPRGGLAYSPEQAAYRAQEIGGDRWLVKAQIHSGARGKAGGIKMCKDGHEVLAAADALLGKRLVTHQTGPAGKPVYRLHVEAAARGGGMQASQARELAFGRGLEPAQISQAAATILGCYRAFRDLDATMVEINPLAVTEDGGLLALDAKMTFDDNALFRRPQIAELRDKSQEDPRERNAADRGLSYVGLDGNVGCIINGAGLAMATMDMIKHAGGEPANFLDIGGGATPERVAQASNGVLSAPK